MPASRIQIFHIESTEYVEGKRAKFLHGLLRKVITSRRGTFLEMGNAVKLLGNFRFRSNRLLFENSGRKC